MKKLFLSLLLLSLATIGFANNGFSVSSTLKVDFVPGNVQYHAGTGAWRFAPTQYAVVGVYNNIRLGNPDLNVWIDLFGWSTTSTYFGVNASNKDADYYGDFVDWGAVFEDGVTWRTPTRDEWQYILTGRANAAQLWGEGGIIWNDNGNNQVNGVFLLPDDWTTPAGINFEPGFIPEIDYDHGQNVYDLDQWETMEAAGAVFLPYAGYRVGGEGNTWNGASETTEVNPETDYFSWVSNVQVYGYYWTSTPHPTNANLAYYVLAPGLNGAMTAFTVPVVWSRELRRGNSVRLIKEHGIVTGVSSVSRDGNVEPGVVKRVVDGRVVIEKNGVTYDVTGSRLH
jgi:hypothetical protein